MSASRGTLGLWIGAVLLAASGGYLWAAAASAGPLGPFYLGNLLLHALGGLALLPAFAFWWWRRRGAPDRARALDLGGLLLLGSALAALVLFALGNRRGLQPLVWIHVALAAAGLAALLAAAGRPRGILWRLSAVGLVLALLLPGVARLVLSRQAGAAAPFNAGSPSSMADEAMGGKAGPFYPSALHVRQRVRDGGTGTLPARAVAESQACGRSGCHPGEVAEWSASPHRFSGLDNPWYRRTYDEMRRTFGAVPARWCGGCHTPALLASGGMDLPVEEAARLPAATAGVSCTVCHAARVDSTRGQGGVEIDLPPLHALATSSSAWARGLHDLLVRIDPEPHARAYSRFRVAGSSSELCAACHKARMDTPVNDYRTQAVMDDYGPWQATSASGQSMTQSIYFPPPQGCAGCHMASGSHRFAAANTALPTLHGDRRQLAAVVDFLRAGRVTVDVFAMTPGRPLAAPGTPTEQESGEIYAPLGRLPAALRRGESARFDLVVRTRGVGHRFPGGKDVPKDCWLEVRAEDERGRVIFWSGKAEEDTEVDPGAHFFSGLWIDQHGRPMRGYESWNDHIEVYSQRLEANTTAVVRVRVDVPPEAGERLTLSARVRYRKLPLSFTRWVFQGPGAARLGLPPEPAVPIVTLAETSLALPVVAAGAPLPGLAERSAGKPSAKPTVNPVADFERWNDYAFALANQGDYDGARRAFRAALALRPEDAEVWTTLGNLEWVAGDLAAARAGLGRALRLSPGLARAHYYLGLVEREEGNPGRAVEHLRAAAVRFPRDATVQTDLGKTLLQTADYWGAAAALERAVTVNAEDATAHFMLTMAHRALGQAERSRAHMLSFNRFRMFGGSSAGARYVNDHPDVRQERGRLHEHLSTSLAPGSPDAP